MFTRYSEDLFVVSINNLIDLQKVSMCLYNVLHLPYFINVEAFGKFGEYTVYYVFVKCSEDLDGKIQEEIKKALHKEEK
mgnify:FL=1